MKYEQFKKEYELDKLYKINNVQALSTILKSKNTIVYSIMTKLLYINLFKNVNTIKYMLSKEFGLYVHYNKEAIIPNIVKEVIATKNYSDTKQLFDCYFIDKDITINELKKIESKEKIIKYILKDFIRLRDFDFNKLNYEDISECYMSLLETYDVAYHNMVNIKKWFKKDYKLTYYVLFNNYKPLNLYNEIHKIISKVCLKEKIKILEAENLLLTEHIKYMPGGEGYLICQNNFNNLKR